MADKYKKLKELNQKTLKVVQKIAIKELVEWLRFLKEVNNLIK